MKDKVVWITGASSGIGAACARAFGKAGAKCILSARSIDKLKALQDSLMSESHILPLDVSKTEDIGPATVQANKHFGPIDILINNAGISQRGLVKDTQLSVDRRLFEVNYFGNIAITKAILPAMIEKGSGHVVVISSVAGKVSTPGRSSYAASKHALIGFYDALRAEVLDHGVHVNMICPGYIKTDISLHALDASGKAHGIMDPGQAQGMSADLCALKILNAVEKNKRETYIGGREVKFVRLRSWFPFIYHNMIAKMAREGRY